MRCTTGTPRAQETRIERISLHEQVKAPSGWSLLGRVSSTLLSMPLPFAWYCENSSFPEYKLELQPALKNILKIDLAAVESHFSTLHRIRVHADQLKQFSGVLNIKSYLERKIAVEQDQRLCYTRRIRRSGRVVEGGTLLRCYTSLTGYRGFESLLLRKPAESACGSLRPLAPLSARFASPHRFRLVSFLFWGVTLRGGRFGVLGASLRAPERSR